MAQLEIYDGAKVYVYGEDAVVDVDLSLAERETDGQVEYESVDVTLCSSTFLGKGSFFDLPTESQGEYRARLVMPFATVEGVIRRSDVRQEPAALLWHLTLTTRGVEVLYERLEAQAVIWGDTTTANVKEIARDTGVPSDVTYTWYNLFDAFDDTKQAITNITVEFQSVRGTNFTLDVRYIDTSAQERTIERTPNLYVTDPASPDVSAPYAPDWTARDLLRVLAEMLAWRIRVQWAAFPSETLVVEILTDRFLPATSLPVLDAALVSSYEVSREEPPLRDFGLAYANHPASEPFLHASANHLTEGAYYAATRIVLSGDGEPTNADLQRIDLLMPQVWNDETTDVAVIIDLTNHPDYTEDITHATAVIESRAADEAGSVYVGAFYDPGTGRRFVVRREPTNPAAGQAALVGEHFAANLARNFQMVRLARYTFEGDFDRNLLSSAPVAGDPQRGVRFLGARDWVVSEREQSLTDGTLRIKGALPDDFTELPTVTQPPPVSPVVGLECTCIFKGGIFYEAILDWDAPVNGAQAPPDSYDVYRREIGVDPVPVFVANTTSTAYIDGGLGAGTYEYSVQSVNAFGKSAFRYCTTQCGP